MPPKKKQKIKHSTAVNTKPKIHVGGHGRRAKGAPSQPVKPTRAQCPCLKFGFQSCQHSSGKPDDLPVTLNTGFLSLRVNNLRRLVETQKLGLESAGARRWLACVKRSRAIVEQARVEQQRKAEEERLRREAAIGAASFLSFRYGRTIEERTNVGRWPAHQLVLPHPILQQPNIVTPSVPSNAASNVLEPSITPSFNPDTSSIVPKSNCDINPISSTLRSVFLPVAVPIERPPSPTDSVSSNKYALCKLSIQTPDSEPPTPTDTGTMANQPTRDLTGGVDASIKDLIQQLFFLQQHISTFRNDKQAGLINQAEEVARSIGRLEDQVSRPDNPLHNLTIAPEIIDYVEDGRNPDIYTRDFVELVQRGNSVMNGKQKAFRDFSKIYAKALKDNFDGLGDEVDMIMAESGLIEKNGKFVEKGMQNGNSN